MQRLNIPFSCHSPEIDESPLLNESPQQQVLRLAEAKAVKVAESEPAAMIIGSDQLATLNGKILGKPGNHDNAYQQLQEMSGHCVLFYTALCLFNTITGGKQRACIPYKIFFRELSDQQIERYLTSEQPYQCAGSFKSEALGISLVKQMEGADPTALIGLPLIKLTEMLQKENYILP